MKRSFIPIVSQPGVEGPGGFSGMPAVSSARAGPATIFSGYARRPLEGWIITSHQPIKAARHIVWASRCTLSPPVNWVPSPSMPSATEDAEDGNPVNGLSSTPWRPCAPITFAAGDTVCIWNGNTSNTNSNGGSTTTTTAASNSSSSSLFEIRVIVYTPSSNQADFIIQPLKNVLGGPGGSFSSASPHDVTQHWPGTECDPEEIAMRAVDEVDAKNNSTTVPTTTPPLPPLSSASTVLSAPSVGGGVPQTVKFTSGLPAIKPLALPPTTLPLPSQQQQQQQPPAAVSPALSTSPMVGAMGLPFKRPANFCNYFGFTLPQKPYVCGGLPGIAPGSSGNSGSGSGNGSGGNDDGDILQISGGTSSLLSSSSATALPPQAPVSSGLPSTAMLPSTVPSSSTSTAASIQQQQQMQMQMQGGNKKDDPAARMSGFRGSSMFSQKISMTVARKKRDMAVGQSVQQQQHHQQQGSTSPAPLSLSSSSSSSSLLSSSSSSNKPQALPSFPVIVSASSPAVKDAPLVPSPKQSFFSLGTVASLPLAVPPIVGSPVNKIAPAQQNATKNNTSSINSNDIPGDVPKGTPSIAPNSIPKVVSGNIPSVAPSNIPSVVPNSVPNGIPSVVSSNSATIREEPVGDDGKEPCESCNPIANFNDVESVNARGAPDAPRLVELFNRYTESFARFRAEYAKRVGGSSDASLFLKEFNDLICAHRLEEQQAVISSEISLLCPQGEAVKMKNK